MFARTVRMQLKPNSVQEFTRLVEEEGSPGLRKQAGFKDEVTFAPSEGGAAVEISLWEQRENADAYHRGPFQKLLQAMARLVEGTPQVQTCEVSNSTWRGIRILPPSFGVAMHRCLGGR
jgi:quinol monooxygenase YgiN